MKGIYLDGRESSETFLNTEGINPPKVSTKLKDGFPVELQKAAGATFKSTYYITSHLFISSTDCQRWAMSVIFT